MTLIWAWRCSGTRRQCLSLSWSPHFTGDFPDLETDPNSSLWVSGGLWEMIEKEGMERIEWVWRHRPGGSRSDFGLGAMQIGDSSAVSLVLNYNV